MSFVITTRTELFPHQRKAVEKLLPLRVGALFMEIGTGRTRTAIELAARRARRISSIIWFCPLAIRETIQEEIRRHCGEIAPCWNIIGIESMSCNMHVITDALDRINEHSFVILDQSHYIKEYRTKRSNRIIRAAARAQYRLIMSGLPVSQGVQDLYTQFCFLSEKILGYRSFYSFSANHLEYDRFHPQRVIRAHNLEYLSAKIAPYVFQSTREECELLPDRLYSSRRFSMTPRQRDHYRRLKEEVLREGVFDSHSLFTLFTRLQQVLSGFRPGADDDMLLLDNPRLEALMKLLDTLDAHRKIVIWGKFQFDLDTMQKHLPPQDTFVLRGEMSREERERQLTNFREHGRILLAGLRLNRYDINLNFADVVIFYNNTFSYAERSRAEKRSLRPGQPRNVLFFDLICSDSIDETIHQCLQKKSSLACNFRRHIDRQTEHALPANWISNL